MKNHVIARPLRVSQLIEIYNAAIGQTHKIHGQHWVSGFNQTDKEKTTGKILQIAWCCSGGGLVRLQWSSWLHRPSTVLTIAVETLRTRRAEYSECRT